MYKLLVMDVDGTLTDGKVYMGNNGEAMKAFDIKDGYAIANILPGLGIEPVIITGRRSEIVANRATELKIKHLYQGIHDKLSILEQLAGDINCSLKEVIYIGDDINDLACMESVGYSACPADAVKEVRDKCNYICKKEGGKGAVRELIEKIRGDYEEKE